MVTVVLFLSQLHPSLSHEFWPPAAGVAVGGRLAGCVHCCHSVHGAHDTALHGSTPLGRRHWTSNPVRNELPRLKAGFFQVCANMEETIESVVCLHTSVPILVLNNIGQAVWVEATVGKEFGVLSFEFSPDAHWAVNLHRVLSTRWMWR